MRYKRSEKTIRMDRDSYFSGLADKVPEEKDRDRFRQPAYQAGQMIRAQAEQIRGDADADQRAD